MFFRTVFFCMLMLVSAGVSAQTDSLQQRFADTNIPKEKIEILLQLASKQESDSLVTINSLSEALNLAVANRLMAEEATVALELGRFYGRAYVNDSLKAYAHKALQLFEEVKDEKGVAEAKILLADAYAVEDKRAEAIALLFESLEYFELTQNSLEMGRTLKQIANSQNYLGYHEDAMRHYSRALEIFQRIENLQGESDVLYNMAIIFREEGNVRESINYFLRSAQLDRNLNNEISLAWTFNSIGSCYLDLRMQDSAYYYFSECVRMAEKHNDNYLKAFGYQQLCTYFNATQNSKKAVELGLKALALAEKMKNMQLLINSHSNLSDSYEALASYQEALYHFRQYQQLSDSVYNTENSRIIHDMQAKYESEKKEKELALKQADIEKKQSKIEEQANQRNMLLAGLVIVLLVTGLIYRGERIKTKAYNELRLKSEEIALKNQVIEEALREKEALLKEIHHRVKNNLQVISSILNMQSRSTANPDMLSAIQEGQSRVKAMALIHQKLYQSEQLSEIDFKEYAEDLVAHLSSVFEGDKNGAVRKTVEASDIKLDVDIAIPLGLILNELISNAYKYAFEGRGEGKISIALKKLEEGKLQLEVADNGNGLPADFSIDKAKSLGLKLVNILTRQLNGELRIRSENGAHFSIVLTNLRMA